MTPLLRRILTEWLEWADSGALDHFAFSRSTGLCDSISEWLDRSGYGARVNKEFDELILEHFGQNPHYEVVRVPVCYPFGGRERWDKDYQCAEMHTNELRLAWVRRVLADG